MAVDAKTRMKVAKKKNLWKREKNGLMESIYSRKPGRAWIDCSEYTCGNRCDLAVSVPQQEDPNGHIWIPDKQQMGTFQRVIFEARGRTLWNWQKEIRLKKMLPVNVGMNRESEKLILRIPSESSRKPSFKKKKNLKKKKIRNFTGIR